MFEAYKIGVKISLVNHASAGLLGLSRAFMKAEGDAARLQKRLASIQNMALKGGAMMGVGAMGLGVIDRMMKPATAYAHQLQLMNVSGMKHLEIVKATTAAWNAAKSTPTTTAAENLAAIRELRMVFGNTSDAIKYMPMVQRMQGVLGNLLGEAGSDQAYTIAKALEMKGAVKNPALFQQQADAITKAMVASGGKVNGSDFLSAFKYGRAATTGWNDTFAYTILPTLIQEMKSSGGSGGSGGPGNALMSMYSAVVGGTIPQKSLKVWEKLGLLDPSKIVWTKTHSAKGVEPGGIVGSGLFQANPFEWTQKILAPALAKAGYGTAEQQKQALQYLFPNRTAGFIATQMLEQPWKFQRDQKLIGGAQGLAAYNELLKNDPEMAELALQKQWQNLQAQLAFTILPELIRGMNWLLPKIEDMTKWAKNHAVTVKVLMGAFAGLSLAMTFGGAVLLLTAAFRGLGLALAFNAIGGASGIVRIAAAIGVWGKAIMFSQVGGPGGILGIGKSLTSVAGGLGLVTQAAVLFMTAYAAWKAGGWLSDQMDKSVQASTGNKNATFGGTLFDYLHPFDAKTGKHSFSVGNLARWVVSSDPNALMGSGVRSSDQAEANYERSRFVGHGKRGQAVQVNSTIHLDGRQIATAVTQHQVNAATRPQTGTSGFDFSQHPQPIGISGSW